MKFTRSLPAKAIAKEKVPMSTTVLSTLTLHQCSICISIENTTKQAPIISRVCVLIHSLMSGVMKVRSFAPLMSIKYMIAVVARPPKMPIFQVRFFLKLKEKKARVMNCTIVPKTKAIATDRNMPMITESAFSVLR